MNDPEPDFDQLADAMIRAAALIRQVRRLDAAELPGLEPQHLQLLDALDRGPTGITQLAEVQAEELSTVSRRISRLVQLDLVAKDTHPDDRRVQVAELTDAGHQVLERIRAQRRETVREVLRGWDPADLVHLERMMVQLAEQLEAG